MNTEAVRVLPCPCPSCGRQIAMGNLAAVSKPDPEFDALFQMKAPDFCWPCQRRLLQADRTALEVIQKCRSESFAIFLRRSVAAG